MHVDKANGGEVSGRLVYEGVDIDEYRAKFGKAEGERRFFAEHAPRQSLPAAAAPRSPGLFVLLRESLPF